MVQARGVSQMKDAIAIAKEVIKEKGGRKSLEIKREDIFGDNAEVDGVVKLGNGATLSETYFLIKEDGEWKIDRIEAAPSR